MTDPDYSGLPDELSVLVTRHWQRFQEVGHVLPDALLKDLPRVWAGSDYVAEQFIRDADLGDWLAGCALKARLEPGRLGEEISQAVMACDDEDALKATLRRLRHRHMVRLIWRDLTGLADYHATVADLSLLADTLIATALEKLYQWACERNGTPRDEQGRP
ncbi:MAG: bifunctional glutamine synthetase adenylyltransferase/deadenyltransferase, partial [Alloalcanivorax venustensis]